MVADERIINILKPVAAEILGADAEILADLLKRKSVYAGYDHQPGATAMANERRAHVATKMRTVIAPRYGWVLVEDHVASGAYEWRVDGFTVRVSKTTPESRQEEAAKTLLAVQPSLFEILPVPATSTETVLIRLRGNPLTRPTVDVISMHSKGAAPSAISLKAIAAANVERLPATSTPGKPRVTLPGVRRAAESE